MSTVSILQNKATAPGTGAASCPGGCTNHMFEVTVSGTGAVSVTIEPRWSLASGTPGAGNLISAAQTVSGTTTASQTFTAEGAAEFVSCPITAISGTGATCTVTYKGA